MINIPLQISTTENNQNTTLPTDKPKFRRYWPVPLLMPSVFEYKNVNKDLALRKDVTTFFHIKVLKWINTETAYKKIKSKKKFLESIDGQMHIYNLLRKFVKHSGINWYDLRDNYALIKDFLASKLNKL
jgi:hypothetical protein